MVWTVQGQRERGYAHQDGEGEEAAAPGAEEKDQGWSDLLQTCGECQPCGHAAVDSPAHPPPSPDILPVPVFPAQLLIF